MKYIDAHCHLHDDRIFSDFPNILNRAENAGIKHAVSCATMEMNFDRTMELAKNHGGVLPCLGIHPWFIDTLSENWKENLGSRLSASRAGVGETGLDFTDKGADRVLQIRIFKAHLSLASDLGLPVNIHIRRAWDELIHILKKTGPLPVPGLIHSYSGSADLVSVLGKYNLYFSFSGAMTRPSAKKVIKALNAVPLDRILFETDAPDLYPGRKGTDKLNEPSTIPVIVQIAAERRNTECRVLAAHAYENGERVFAPLMAGG